MRCAFNTSSDPFFKGLQTIPLLELNSSLWEGNGEEEKLTLMQKKKVFYDHINTQDSVWS